MRLGSQMLGRSKKLVLDTPSSGKDANVKRGVKQELTLSLKLVSKLSGLPKCINDRLMPLSDKDCVVRTSGQITY